MKCLPDLEGWAKSVREEKRRRVMMMWQQLESMIQKKQDDCETDLGKKQDTSTVCLELINDVKLVWVVMRENQDNEESGAIPDLTVMPQSLWASSRIPSKYNSSVEDHLHHDLSHTNQLVLPE